MLILSSPWLRYSLHSTEGTGFKGAVARASAKHGHSRPDPEGLHLCRISLARLGNRPRPPPREDPGLLPIVMGERSAVRDLMHVGQQVHRRRPGSLHALGPDCFRSPRVPDDGPLCGRSGFPVWSLHLPTPGSPPELSDGESKSCGHMSAVLCGEIEELGDGILFLNSQKLPECVSRGVVALVCFHPQRGTWGRTTRAQHRRAPVLG